MYRIRKKLGLVASRTASSPTATAYVPEDTPSTSMATSTSQSDRMSNHQLDQNSSFSNKQTKCRSSSRAEKALPNSPNKRTEIIGTLAQKYQLRIVLHEKPGPKHSELNNDELE